MSVSYSDPNHGLERYASFKKRALPHANKLAATQPAAGSAPQAGLKPSPELAAKNQKHFAHGHHNRSHYKSLNETEKFNMMKAQLADDLKAAKGSPQRTAEIGMQAIHNADPAFKSAMAAFVLDKTEGADKAQFMVAMVKASPSSAQWLATQSDRTKLSGDLSAVGQDLAILPLKTMDIASATLPAHLKLSGNQDGLAPGRAPGLNVLNTTGTIKAQGADVRGGEGAHNDTVKNALKLSQAGAKTNFAPRDAHGNNITLSQAGTTAQATEAMKPMRMRHPHHAFHTQAPKPGGMG